MPVPGAPTGNLRDLEAARKAHANRDPEASKAAHLIKKAPEAHKKGGEYIKNIVFGGLDGIITTFAVVSGATGGGLSVEVILILGFSNIFADAFSMGMGDALSTKAEHEYIRAERKREEWELENFAEGEIEEMIDLYEQRGMSRADATDVINKMAKYPQFFVDVMMTEELGLQVPGDDENPWKDGLVTFASFVAFGLVPLLAYAILHGSNLDMNSLFAIACVLSAMTLFLLGAIKTKFSVMPWWKGGLEILFMGSFTALASYLVGWAVNAILAASGTDVSGGGHLR